jgi:hypothetical protein
MRRSRNQNRRAADVSPPVSPHAGRAGGLTPNGTHFTGASVGWDSVPTLYLRGRVGDPTYFPSQSECRWANAHRSPMRAQGAHVSQTKNLRTPWQAEAGTPTDSRQQTSNAVWQKLPFHRSEGRGILSGSETRALDDSPVRETAESMQHTGWPSILHQMGE